MISIDMNLVFLNRSWCLENRPRTQFFQKLIFSKTMLWDYIHMLSRWSNKWSWTISL